MIAKPMTAKHGQRGFILQPPVNLQFSWVHFTLFLQGRLAEGIRGKGSKFSSSDPLPIPIYVQKRSFS